MNLSYQIPQLIQLIKENLNIQLHIRADPEGYTLVESIVNKRDLFTGSLAELKEYLLDLIIVEGEIQKDED